MWKKQPGPKKKRLWEYYFFFWSASMMKMWKDQHWLFVWSCKANLIICMQLMLTEESREKWYKNPLVPFEDMKQLTLIVQCVMALLSMQIKNFCAPNSDAVICNYLKPSFCNHKLHYKLLSRYTKDKILHMPAIRKYQVKLKFLSDTFGENIFTEFLRNYKLFKN